MKTNQLERVGCHGPPDGRIRSSGRNGEAELGVVVAGGDIVVRVGLDSRCDPDEDRHWIALHSLDAVQFVERVDNDSPDTGLDCLLQLVGRLVVAVHDEPTRRDAGSEGDLQFATGRDVEAHAGVVGELRHGSAQECLGGVDDSVRERFYGCVALVAKVLLVVHEEGTTEFGGEVECVAAADRQSTVVDRRVHREQREGERSGHALEAKAS